jgi:hypothetical protein
MPPPLSQSQLPPAGWYPDPQGAGLRWWDGGRWSDHVEAGPVATASNPESDGRPAPTARPVEGKSATGMDTSQSERQGPLSPLKTLLGLLGFAAFLLGCIAVVAVVVTLVFHPGSGASEPAPTGSQSTTERPAGGYDAQGFPLDENGDVSSNPDDYHQSVCETELFEDDPSC